MSIASLCLTLNISETMQDDMWLIELCHDLHSRSFKLSLWK